MQGLVVRGYGRLPHATFLACVVRDPAGARAFLRDRIGDVTTGLGPAAGHALNIAFTAPGLVAVGLPGRRRRGRVRRAVRRGHGDRAPPQAARGRRTGGAGALGLGRPGHRRRST